MLHCVLRDLAAYEDIWRNLIRLDVEGKYGPQSYDKSETSEQAKRDLVDQGTCVLNASLRVEGDVVNLSWAANAGSYLRKGPCVFAKFLLPPVACLWHVYIYVNCYCNCYLPTAT